MFNDILLEKIKTLNFNDEIYLVGGYLRNWYINKTISNDRDIVCLKDSFALANLISKELDGTLIELDKENQIYRVVLKNKLDYFDVSLALENDIEKDAKRRDFTINSIYYNIKKEEIFDPLNGIKDIEDKILKTSDLKNITDDPLRLLRLYRFYSITNFKIDEELNLFVKSNFEKINTVAPERINHEIIEIFSGEYLVETLLKMLDDNVLEIVFPFVREIKRVPSNSHHHLDLIHHSIETVKNIRINKPLLKLAAFYHDIGKPTTWTIEPVGRHRFIGHDIKGGEIVKDELKKLNFSNKQITYISKMVANHIYPCALLNANSDNKKAYARFIKKIADDTPDLLELSRADRLSAQGEALSKEIIEKTLNHLENLLNYYNEVKNEIHIAPFLNGEEIMQILNLKPSEKIGKILDILKEMQLGKEIITKEDAINFIKSTNFDNYCQD